MRKSYNLINVSTELDSGDIIREPNSNEDYDYLEVISRLDNQNYEVQPFSIDKKESSGVRFYYPFDKMIKRNCEKLE